jgi:drug/metabolite transporter (DMT)-like permease
VVLVPAVALLWPRTDWSEVSAGAWLAVAYMALFSSLIGYVAWFWALGRGGIARISAWQLGQPVLTVVFSALLLGERVTVSLVVAGAAVLLGTALTQVRPRR